MIERKFVENRKKEFRIQETISSSLNNVGHSHTQLLYTPLGEKIIIHTSRPGLVVGRKGKNIIMLNKLLKTKFNLDNPQIEINEVENPNLDPIIVAERIASTLERFGLKRFKGSMHRALSDVLDAGALGVEITVSGKVPSARARTWRVFGGYIKKCGDMATDVVRKATALARMRSGVVGIGVKIMPNVSRPDDISLREEPLIVKEEVVVEKKTTKKKTTTKKRTNARKQIKPTQAKTKTKSAVEKNTAVEEKQSEEKNNAQDNTKNESEKVAEGKQMSKKRMSEIRNLKEEALNERLLQTQKNVVLLRSKMASGSASQNTSAMKQTKKTIARLLTIIHQKRRKNKRE